MRAEAWQAEKEAKERVAHIANAEQRKREAEQSIRDAERERREAEGLSKGLF